MIIGKASKLGAILLVLSHWRAKKRPAGNTAGLFFFSRNTQVRSRHERTLRPTKNP